MQLQIRPGEHIVPSYSLTGDLLSYSRCRLQYRYHNGSALPPSRPVQLWFGEFLHGSLELCYQFWSEQHSTIGSVPSYPWPCTPRIRGQAEPAWEEHDIGRFASTVEERLARQGKQARSTDARRSAYERLEAAVNELSPHLFPLIFSAEQKVIGTREVPNSARELRCDNYEVHGVIDVLTHMTMSSVPADNPLRRAIEAVCPALESEFEVVVDYKGTRRPLSTEQDWLLGNWQLQTYAWLRQRQDDALPVRAGILIYINELVPGAEEIRNIRRGIANGTADVVPDTESRDEQLIRLWRTGDSTSQLSLEFRLRRAIRVLPITADSKAMALDRFDEVVRRIEEDIVEEAAAGDILKAWSPDCDDEATCAACDFRYFCPQPHDREGPYEIGSPRARGS